MTGWTEVAFWVLAVLIFYTYVGYPLALVVLGFRFERPVRQGASEPYVSVIISAFNEEKDIEAKLTNLLEMDYPQDKMEVLVGSDGASDKTDDIVSRVHSSRVRFFRFVSNFGKPHVLNALVEESHGSVLVFTDARQRLERSAIRMLVRNFADPAVGCVSGEMYFEGGTSGRVEVGMDAYWRYEKFLRKKESELGSMLGATGALYAIRRDVFPKLPVNILVDDMYIPLVITQKKYRAVFESEAKAFDRPSARPAQEFTRKVRTLAGNYQIFSGLPDLFLPWKSAVAWQLFSHKFLRLMVPFFLIGIFLANLFLRDKPLYHLFFLLQTVFYGLAFFEGLSEKCGMGKKGIGYIPYMFCLLNYCAFMALPKFISSRKKKAAWEKAYA